MARLAEQSPITHLDEGTSAVIDKERERRGKVGTSTLSGATQKWQHAAALALRSRSNAHYKDQINVSTREHMSGVDSFNGGKARKGSIGEAEKGDNDEDDLLVIHPVVDGRLKDEGRN